MKRTRCLRSFATLVAMVALGVSLVSRADDTRLNSFEETVRYAVLNNPGVLAAYEAFEASGYAVRAARGGYLPRLDLSGEYGEVDKESPTFPEDDFDYHEARLTLTQMLFDGFETWFRVDELSAAQRAAFFELRRASEQTALEAAQAYIDVLRYQSLVRLAELNLAEHHNIYQHVEQRTAAGVSRGVDLEQANARLALADFNLLQEVTNLHDVVARFHRIVTALPSDTLSAPEIPTGNIPDTRFSALDRAYQLSPLIQREIAQLESRQAATKGRRAPFMPQLDLRLRAEDGNDIDGIYGDHNEEAVELVLTYNLYNGGSDLARKREAHRRQNEAYDLRVKACHDVRQNLVISYNDIQSIDQRLVYLARNELSIEKARQAYRKQFDIGQRTLLDLLDSENEYFDVSRSLSNARYDLALAQVRTLAAMGVLTGSLDAQGKVPADRYEHVASSCPQEVGPDMDAYFARKERLLDRLRAGDQEAYRMDVRFAFNSDEIDASYDADLKDAAQYMKENPAMSVQVLGHTDSVGSEEYNQKLSERRAKAVRQALVKMGIAAERIEAIGKGELAPVADNESREGRAQNRRTEFVPIKPQKPAVTPLGPPAS